MIKSKPLSYFLILISTLLVSQSLFAGSGLNDCGFDYSSAQNNYGGFYNSGISPAESAFAAIKADGSISSWGVSNYGGSGAPTDPGYVSIASTYSAFAALKADGSISAWGDSTEGGSGAPTGSEYVSIASTYAAFAALKADGSISAWGNGTRGGNGAPTGSGYVSITSTQSAFAALKADGSISAWGEIGGGGFSESLAPTDADYVFIASNRAAFAALKADGSISAWGSDFFGGDVEPTDAGYVSIASTLSAFAALKADGSISAWGGSNGGSGAPTDLGYVSIASNANDFAALKADGSISAWGSDGGSGAPTDSGYVSIASNAVAFAAMKADGSIAAWGDSTRGGSGAPTDAGYVSIASNPWAFAALKADGSISVWGSSIGGADIVSDAPTDSGYVSIASAEFAFAALKADGSISAWGAWYDYSRGPMPLLVFAEQDAPRDSGYVSINGVGSNTPTDCVFRLDLNPTNHPPVADEQTVVTAENTAVDVTLTGRDPEDDPISFALVDEPVNGGLSGAIPLLTYTPNVGFTGTDSFTFIANDGTSDSEPATVSITVSEAPDGTAPVITLNGPALINLGVGDTYTEAGATAEDDRDGEVGVEINGTVDTATAGEYSITYTASDAKGNTATETRTVTVSEDTGGKSGGGSLGLLTFVFLGSFQVTMIRGKR